MKWILIACVLLVSINIVSQPKAWENDFKLDWSYFQIVTELPEIVYYTEEERIELERDRYKNMAHTGTMFKYDIKLKKSSLTFEIINEMYPKYSWVLINVKTKETLVHEQGHFDIEEYFARLLRKQVEEFIFTPDSFGEQFDVLFTEIRMQSYKYQELYDLETEYGTNYEKQILFTAKIDSMLNATKQYEEVLIHKTISN